MNPPIPGTVVLYGPFFSRTGFGVLARGWAMALHEAGVKVRLVPVDCNDPNAAGQLDDCDWYLLQSLKYTPLTTPVTAIFAYVGTYVWPKMALPEPCQRILLTTFDSTSHAATPPPRLIFIGNQMDQVWLSNENEENAWKRGGLDPAKCRSFNWPHEWIDNPRLGPPVMRARKAGEPFRFLHISLFLPRRRLDVLIRAFLEEFRQENEAELYLKMSYPTWHPVPGKPKKDLLALIERLRRETGSPAQVIVDDTLGTRLELARQYDRCDAYVSPDTTHTAPVAEAIVRQRPVIITDGWGVDMPPQALVVPNSTERVAITPEMADYLPHQRGTSFPALDTGLMRQALRRMFALTADERKNLVGPALEYMRERYTYAAAAPAALKAIREGLAAKCQRIVAADNSASAAVTSTGSITAKPLNIHWSGLQLFYGKIPTANREICLELLRRGHRLSLMPGNGPFHIEEFDLSTSEKYGRLARKFYEPLPGNADFTVSYRWHPVFNEQTAARQIMANTWPHGAIPDDWLRPIRQYVSELWVPSRFVSENFQRSGVASEQLQVIPLGIDPQLFRPGITQLPLRTKKQFKFLFVGETTTRKGLDLVLSAYLKTFTKKDDVCLVIKDMDCEDFYGRLVSKTVLQELQSNPSAPAVEYIPAMLTEEKLAALYAACDCFVQPHRLSSSGLAVMEAMACGLPVITTKYGGVLDFCRGEMAYLLPAREVRQRTGAVGHWKVSGEQIHAEPDARALQDRMEHVFKHASEAKQRGASASEHVRQNFSWAKTVDQIEARFQALQDTAPEHVAQTATAGATVAKTEAKQEGPTIVIFAPFYNRSGYGVAARALAVAFNSAGLKIKTIPVDNVEEGIDDCDMAWLKSLETTPVTLPVVAIFFHVPSPHWLQVKLPPQSIRVMFTTFDSSAQGNLPPADWISVCQQMDQVWLMTEKEATCFESAGLPRAKIQLVKPPHPWLNNPMLPLADTAPQAAGQRFRFLSISMYQPRRRWDTLLEAFLTEFKDSPEAELYLKVNYPSWHPVPGQPQRDLRQLIDSLRLQTGSKAAVVLDESLDTRRGICRLMDSCDAYVSTDTSITAPVGEAFVRNKIAVIPDGFGVVLPYCEAALVIPVDPKLTRPMTEEMLAYQPHHRGKEMPLLRVEDVRRALRSAFEMPARERHERGHLAGLVMECAYGASIVMPGYVTAMNAGLQKKFSAPLPGGAPSPSHSGRVKVDWVGSFLDFGSLSHVNRELTRALADFDKVRLQCVNTPTAQNGAATPEELKPLSRRLAQKTSAETHITVRHAWPPDWQRPQSGKLVVIQPWEFGALPEEWVKDSVKVDEFWVPSQYVRRVFIDSGVPSEKVVVVPNGVDLERFHPQVAPMKLATGKKFKFLFVGGTIFRKGPDLLLKAFLDNFTAADDVCLVIKDFGGKSVYAGQTIESQIRAAQARPDAPEILYLTEELPPDCLPGLYTACDALVLPYRGEGFGLPVLEAMACGRPVLVTAGGATDDFVRDEFAWRIPAERWVFGHEVSGMKLAGAGWLLSPDVVALGRFLREAFANPVETRRRGQLALEQARQFCSWTHAAAVAAQRIHHLHKPGLPNGLEDHANVPPAKKPPVKETKLVLPPCALIGHLGEARGLVHKKQWPAAWKSVLAAISARPFHPEAYLLLAEIALAVGDSEKARRCAKASRDMAPGWAPPKQFLGGNLRGHAEPEWLHLPALLMDEATAAPHPRVTVCLIAKNEERFISQCLRSVQSLASQIIVVDTGSTDRTIELAKAAGAEVHSFTWCDDFSAARNAALEHATGDWILMLDADEVLKSGQEELIACEMRLPAIMGYRLPIVDQGREEGGCSYVPRLFRNAPALFFVGRIHEQVFSSIQVRCQQWGLKHQLGKTVLLHYGYTEEVMASRQKVERNLRLLERAVDESPEEPNLVMNLGLELVRSGQLPAGLERYWAAFRLSSAMPEGEVTPELKETLLTQLATHLMASKKFADIVELWKTPFARKAGLTASQHFCLGAAFMELKQPAEAAEQMRQCLAKRDRPAFSPLNPEILKAGPHHCLAMCLTALKDNEGAQRAFEAAMAADASSRPLRFDLARFQASQGQTAEALKWLGQLTTEQPSDARAWEFGGLIALSRPEHLAFALEWTGQAVKTLPEEPRLLLQRAEALMLNQDVAQALPLWRRWQEAGGKRSRAALVLCELLTGDRQHHFTTAEEPALSQEVVQWYRQCIRVGAHALVHQLHGRLESVRLALPSFVRVLEAAHRQARAAAA